MELMRQEITVQRVPIHRLIFVASIIYLVLMYLIPLHLFVQKLAERVPLIGEDVTFVIYMVLIYLVILACVYIFSGPHAWATEDTFATITLLGSKRSTKLLDLFCVIGVPILWLVASAYGQISLPLIILAAVIFATALLNLLIPDKTQATQTTPYPTIRPLTELTTDTPEDVGEESPSEAIADKEYEWSFAPTPYLLEASERKFHAHIELSLDTHQRFVDLNEQLGPDAYLTNPKQYVCEGVTKEVVEIAKQIEAHNEQNDYCAYDRINNVLAYVRQFQYSPDIESKGVEKYGRFPIETLHDETGDNDCFSLLFAALMWTLGYDVIILNPPGHIAVGVSGAAGLSGSYIEHNGKWYYYCEIAGLTNSEDVRGWRVGEIPEEYWNMQIPVYEVE